MEKTVTIDLGQRSYDVRIAVGLLDAVGQTVASMRNVSRVVVITDDRVEKLYARGVLDSLRAEQLPATLISFASGEINKNLKTYAMLFDKLFAVAPPIDRDSVIVALGGGVVGDVAGFVAATALRGLRWMQCPTTLLADVDASVGGKTAVDHAAGKNLIGAFHQPGAVLIDVETLRTTSEQVMQSGLSECVKHGVIRDAGLLDFIEENLDRILTRDADVMTELIARNVAIKGAVVSADERESAQRAHLNLGHTFAHAIETFLGYDKITHGAGVALGMVAACRLAVKRKLIDTSDARRVEAILEKLGLPTSYRDLDPDEMWEIMQHDKKARGGIVRLVLPVGLGQVDVFSDVTDDSIREAIASLNE